MTELDFKNGKVLLIDKPLGWTSFNVVKKIRYLIQKKYNIKKIKVGHAGTLDPLASGVLIVCTGKMTKQISSFQDTKKEYIATIKFGATTPSYDLETEIDEEYPFQHITLEKLKTILSEEFTGTIQQKPPIFSAKQINGVRAYEYARSGQKIEMKTAEVKVHEVEIISDFELMPTVRLRISCSKGTYIRSLAHDLGQALGSGAHLTGLIRTKVGDFKIEDTITIEHFEETFSAVNKEVE